MMGPSLSEGPDAAITALPPLLPSNLLRDMDENRMIVLLKDLLSADDAFSGARHTFAESFMALMQAATRRTSPVRPQCLLPALRLPGTLPAGA